MKVTGYRTLVTNQNWGRPIGDVNGVTVSDQTPLGILILETDIGVDGVGLGSADGIERVFPAVDGHDPRAVTFLYDRMLAYVFKAGHGGAIFDTIGSIDMALWDLKAKLANEPLWRTLGARDRFVPGYASGLDFALSDDQIATLYRGYADHGFSAGKLKGGLDVDSDRRRLQIVRDQLAGAASAPTVMLDVNESWNRSQAVRYVTEIERSIDLAWIEEPVRRWDFDGLAAVRSAVRAGVATGENLTGLEQYVGLLRALAVDVVQAGSVWGITHFLRVATLAHAHDLPISPVGFSGNPIAHAAAAVPNHLLTEVQSLTFPDGLDVDQQITDGGIVLGDRPGLGIDVGEHLVVGSDRAAAWGGLAGPHIRPVRAGRTIGLTSDAATADGPS